MANTDSITKRGKVNPGERESELTNAVLDIVQRVLTDASNGGGRSRFFPNGIGLVEVQASLDLPKFTLSARIADVQYPPTSGPKPIGQLALFDSELETLKIADDILAYCVSLDDNNDPAMTDCNAFVKKVGSKFGVAIPDTNADGIVEAFKGPPFSTTTMDPAEAMGWASTGLVVAGMKLSELNPTYGTKYKNGHVAIIHATADSAHPRFPKASWGMLGARGQSNASIRLSFPAKACDDKVVHFAYAQTA